MHAPYTRALTYAIIVTLGGLVFGVDLGVIAGTFGYIEDLFRLSDIEIGTVGAAPGFGAIFALIFAGSLSDKLGRKKTIQLIAVLYLASAVASALAPSYWWLVAARFLGGLAFCSLALASMYIGEISPANLRGRLVAINQFNIVIGLTAAYFINFLVQQAADQETGLAVALNLKETAWRWMLGAEVPLAAIWLGLVCLIPESPRWLLMVGREDEARAAMARVMPEAEIPTAVAAVKASMAKSHGVTTITSQLKELTSKHARKALLIGVVIAAVQPITGINAINTYAPIIFAQTGAEDALWRTVWLGVVGLIANVAAYLLVDRLGRRPVVVFGLLWCVASLGLCAWGFHQARYSVNEKTTKVIEDRFDANVSTVLEALVTIEQQPGEVHLIDADIAAAVSELRPKAGDRGSGILDALESQEGVVLLTGDSLAQAKLAVEQSKTEARQALLELRDKVYVSDILFMNEIRATLGREFADNQKSRLIGKAAEINSALILFAILSFTAAFQFSIGPVMWVVLSEVFPTQLRGVAIPGAQLITATVNYFVQQFFPWQLANMGARDIFLFYCLCGTIGLFALAILLPETKNKTIEEIEAELSGSAPVSPRDAAPAS